MAQEQELYILGRLLLLLASLGICFLFLLDMHKHNVPLKSDVVALLSVPSPAKIPFGS